jgi:hypothetical protein
MMMPSRRNAWLEAGELPYRELALLCLILRGRERWRRLPDWCRGLIIYITGVIVICGIPVFPAFITLLILWLLGR